MKSFTQVAVTRNTNSKKRKRKGLTQPVSVPDLSPAYQFKDSITNDGISMTQEELTSDVGWGDAVMPPPSQKLNQDPMRKLSPDWKARSTTRRISSRFIPKLWYSRQDDSNIKNIDNDESTYSSVPHSSSTTLVSETQPDHHTPPYTDPFHTISSDPSLHSSTVKVPSELRPSRSFSRETDTVTVSPHTSENKGKIACEEEDLPPTQPLPDCLLDKENIQPDILQGSASDRNIQSNDSSGVLATLEVSVNTPFANKNVIPKNFTQQLSGNSSIDRQRQALVPVQDHSNSATRTNLSQAPIVHPYVHPSPGHPQSLPQPRQQQPLTQYQEQQQRLQGLSRAQSTVSDRRGGGVATRGVGVLTAESTKQPYPPPTTPSTHMHPVGLHTRSSGQQFHIPVTHTSVGPSQDQSDGLARKTSGASTTGNAAASDKNQMNDVVTAKHDPIADGHSVAPSQCADVEVVSLDFMRIIEEMERKALSLQLQSQPQPTAPAIQHDYSNPITSTANYHSATPVINNTQSTLVCLPSQQPVTTITALAPSRPATADPEPPIIRTVEEPEDMLSSVDMDWIERMEQQAMAMMQQQQNQFQTDASVRGQQDHVTAIPTNKAPSLAQPDVNLAYGDKMARDGGPKTVGAHRNRVKCFRFVALDVSDHYDQRRKEIRCIPYLSNGASTSAVGFENDYFADIETVWLSGSWMDTAMTGGDIFHVILMGESDLETSKNPSDTHVVHASGLHRKSLCVDDRNGLVVVHPDMMISPTRIVDASGCARRGVLSERIKSFVGSGAAAVLGHLKHAFIEVLICLVLPRIRKKLCSLTLSQTANPHMVVEQCLPSELEFQQLIKASVKDILEPLFCLQIRDIDVLNQLRPLVRPILNFLLHQSSPSTSTPSSGRNHVIFEDIVGVEEMIWSPMLGIKGQLDVTVQGMVRQENGSPVSVISPVELKTGKRHPSSMLAHRAQVILYVLMVLLRERSGSLSDSNLQGNSDVNAGIILYVSEDSNSTTNGKADSRPLSTTHVDVVSPSWTDIRCLVSARNRLATGMKTSFEMQRNILPPVLQQRNECESCFKSSECMVYHAAVEGGSSKTVSSEGLFQYSLRGVKESHLEYFRNWDELLSLEALQESESKEQCPWLIPGSILQKETGRCLANLTFIGMDKASNNKEERLLHFKVMNNGSKKVPEISRMDENEVDEEELSSFVLGDRVQLSIEKTGGTTISTNHQYRNHGSSTATRDMEDMLGGVPKEEEAFSHIQPNICSGIVTDLSKSVIQVTVKDIPIRMQTLFRKISEPSSLGVTSHSHPFHKNVFFRLDKDESFSTIPSLRTNILSIITEPYNRKTFHDWNNQRSKSNGRQNQPSSNPNIPQSSPPTLPPCLTPSLQRIRDLVIDLVNPEFDPILSDISKYDVTVLCPQSIPSSTYMKCLHQLDQMLKSKPNNDPKLSKVPITTGHYGEWNVFGGLQVFPGCIPIEIWSDFHKMNIDQRKAIIKLLHTKDYILFLGMPGTGKTSTLSLAIRCLLARGQKVLVTSYTHSAVDNLLLKLKEAGVQEKILLRIGDKGSVHPSLHDYLFSEKIDSISSYAERLGGIRLIACTVLAASKSEIISKLNFDWCIVDEAGQISQPAAIGAIKCARKFVLVGDDYQLPPLVLSPEAAARGMDVSLFKRLAEAHPQAVASLTYQYRMNNEVLVLCNHLIYNYRLRCADETVTNRRLILPFPEKITSPVDNINNYADSENNDWLQTVLRPSTSVAFLNTDCLFDSFSARFKSTETSTKSTSGNSSNLIEAQLVCILTQAMRFGGLCSSSLGLMSPYRDQVKLIRQLLLSFDQRRALSRPTDDWRSEDVLVSTVDKFQGKDVDALVLSTVRNSLEESVGDLLRDWRRINVAITRTKCKLIIIGSFKALEKIPITSELCSLIHSRGWKIDLSREALEIHSNLY